MKQKELQEVQNLEKCREYLKENVCFCLVNKEEKIEKSYCTTFLDLDIVYYLRDKDGELFILSKKIVEQLNLNSQDLEKWAKDNCKKKYPLRIMKICTDEMSEYIEEVKSVEEDSDVSFYAVRMDGAIYGSNVLVYPQIFKKIGEVFGKNYYIIPSSKHEIIILSDKSGLLTNEDVKINHAALQDQIIDKEDFLSKSVYYYNKQTEKISII